MALHGDTWQYMVIDGSAWLYMAIHGNTWQYMVIYGDTWLYMAIHGNTWQYMVIDAQNWVLCCMVFWSTTLFKVEALALNSWMI